MAFLAGTALARPKPKPAPKEDPKVGNAVVRLVECAQEKDDACTATALDEMRGKAASACPLLAAAFDGKGEAVQLQVATALVELKCSQAVELAAKPLADRELDHRGPLAAIFARTKDRSLVEPICEMVRTGRPFDKEKGCEALALLGDASVIPVLVKATTDSFFSVRMQAAAALGRFPSADSRSALCRLVTDDSNPGVRTKAAEALSQLKDVHSVPCLAKALGDRIPAVLTAVHQALVDSAGLDLGNDPAAWEQWWEKYQKDNRKRR